MKNPSAASDLRGFILQLCAILEPSPSLCLPAAESYSVARSSSGGGSVPPPAGSAPQQGSADSSPGSHSSSVGSRHPVSALKKWLSNPVRKLSADARGGVGKVEKQMCRSDRGQWQSLLSHSATQPRPLEAPDKGTIVPAGDTVSLENAINVCVRMCEKSFYSLLSCVKKYKL